MLPMIKAFSDKFYLVGGTAFALQLGHRRSIDFDLFSHGKVPVRNIRRKIEKFYPTFSKVFEDEFEYTAKVNGVKTTFYDFPFEIPKEEELEGIISMPNIITLTAMKAFALGHRAKWKDYVDIYFAFKTYSLDEISRHAKNLFKGEFNERLFRSQIAYYDDIDYHEEVEFMPGFEVSMDEVKSTLTKISTQI